MIPGSDAHIIELYLDGKLREEELAVFKQRMENDSDFSKEVSLQSDIRKGIKAAGRRDLKNQLSSVFNAHDIKTKRIPVARILRIAASVAVITGFGWWWFVIYRPSQNRLPAARELNKQAFAEVNVKIPSQTFATDNSATTHIKLSSGGDLFIPSGSLTDEKGRPLNGKFRMDYRNLNPIFDRYLSGIPSAIDSGSQVRYLWPATLFQLSVQTSANIRFNPSEPVRIAIPADDTLRSNRVFKLDTISKCWIACGDDVIIDTKKYTNEHLTGIFRPRLEDKSKPRFRIMVNEKQFPELAAYKNFIFEIAPQETHYDPSDDQQVWKNIRIEKAKTGEPYQVTFSNDVKTVTYKVFPVFAKEYYAQAMKTYNGQIGKLASSSFQGAELEKYKLAQQISLNSNIKENGTLFRVLSLSSPGIYSDSKLLNLDENFTYEVSFTDQEGNALSLSQVAIAYLSKGILKHLKTGPTIRLTFDNTSGTAILATTSDNRLAYLTPQEFREIFSGQKVSLVKLHVTDINQKNYRVLKEKFGDKEMAVLIRFLTFKKIYF